MIIYICTPYRADTEKEFQEQLIYTKTLARRYVLAGHDVIVPHLYYPSFLDDNLPEERDFGMHSARNLISACHKVIVGTKYGVSMGMLKEIDYAHKHNIKTEDVK